MSEIGKNYVNQSIEENTQEIEMTVYTALNKRKIYLDRLNKIKAVGTTFVGTKTQNQADIAGMKPEDFENKCKSNYDKAVAIIRNFYELNAAITRSNALTEVEIAGVTYTVAEALVRYDRANSEIEFLNSIAENVAKARALINKYNTDKLSDKAITDYVTRMISSINLPSEGTDDTAIMALKDKLQADYIAANTITLVDPYNHADSIQDKMDALREFIEDFNEKINISNMQTVIKVNLVND